MKKLKITKRVVDKLTRESLVPGEVVERSEARCKDFIKAGVAEYLEPEKEIKVEAEEVKAKPKKKRKSKKAE